MALKIPRAIVDETESSLPTTVLQWLSELVMWAEGTLHFFSSWCMSLSGRRVWMFWQCSALQGCVDVTGLSLMNRPQEGHRTLLSSIAKQEA